MFKIKNVNPLQAPLDKAHQREGGGVYKDGGKIKSVFPGSKIGQPLRLTYDTRNSKNLPSCDIWCTCKQPLHYIH